MGGARRLRSDERRTQLVDIGRQLVAASSFDAVSIDHVAKEAGISRSLLFHYFPDKRTFQVAVAEASAQDLLAATEPDPDLPPDERLRASLHAFVDYVSQRQDAFVSLIRGATGGEPGLRDVFDRAHTVVASRILEGVGVTPGTESALLRIAVRGWVAFLEEAVVVWLDSGEPSQDELVGVIEAALVAAVATADVDRALSVIDLFSDPVTR